MKLFCKKNFLFLIVGLFLFIVQAFAIDFPIDAQKNAQAHNNQGVLYMRERNYFAAIQEFKIAIAINPYHQATAVYFNNLGCAYLELAKIQNEHGIPKEWGDFGSFAQVSFEDAIKQDPMKLGYYQNIVDSFELQNSLSKELKKYQKDSVKNPLSKIIVALIYVKQNKIQNAQINLDDFMVDHPDLIINSSLKTYLRQFEDD